MSLFPSSMFSHPDDVRAGETESDDARSVCGSRCAVGRIYVIHNKKGAIYFIRMPQRGTNEAVYDDPPGHARGVDREKKIVKGAGGQPRGIRRSVLLRTGFVVDVKKVHGGQER